MVRGVFNISAKYESSVEALNMREPGTRTIVFGRLRSVAAHGIRMKGVLLSSGAIMKMWALKWTGKESELYGLEGVRSRL